MRKKLIVLILVLLSSAVSLALSGAALWQSQKYPTQPKSYTEAYNTSSEQKNEETLWDMATYEPITVFTAALVIIGSIQAVLFVWQLLYIRAGIDDAKVAADSARDAANAASAANALSRELFDMDTRPWISATISADSDYRTAHDGTPFIYVKVTLKNYGKTPALNVRSRVGLVAYSLESIIEGQKEIEQYMGGAVTNDLSNNYGDTLFPTEILEDSDQLSIWNWKHGNVDIRFRLDPLTTCFEDNFVQGYIIGVVNYRFTSNGFGLTKFAYGIAKNAPSHMLIVGVGGAIQRSDGSIPQKDIILYRANVGNLAQ